MPIVYINAYAQLDSLPFFAIGAYIVAKLQKSMELSLCATRYYLQLKGRAQAKPAKGRLRRGKDSRERREERVFRETQRRRDNRDYRDGRDNRDERDERDNNEVEYQLSLSFRDNALTQKPYCSLWSLRLFRLCSL